MLYNYDCLYCSSVLDSFFLTNCSDGYGVKGNLQKCFSYIVAVSFIGEENNRPVLWSTPRHEWFRTHNLSGDRR